MLKSKTFFDVLLQEKLSSVTFVMDYLQLDFAGNRVTLNLWPKVNSNSNTFEFGNSDYRNVLCSLIGKTISEVELQEDILLKLTFTNNDYLLVSLDPANPEIVTPEIVTFTDTKDNLFVL